jgi:hypothetical protein
LKDKYADQWHDPTLPEEPKSDANVQADDEWRLNLRMIVI